MQNDLYQREAVKYIKSGQSQSVVLSHLHFL